MLILKKTYITNGIIAALLVMSHATQAFSGITFYSTRLPWYACYNSKGMKLKNVANILKQERVIFHKTFKEYFTSAYQNETFFSSSDNRKFFSLAKIQIPKELANRIKQCEPVNYTVYVYTKKQIRVRAGLIHSRAG